MLIHCCYCIRTLRNLPHISRSHTSNNCRAIHTTSLQMTPLSIQLVDQSLVRQPRRHYTFLKHENQKPGRHGCFSLKAKRSKHNLHRLFSHIVPQLNHPVQHHHCILALPNSTKPSDKRITSSPIHRKTSLSHFIEHPACNFQQPILNTNLLPFTQSSQQIVHQPFIRFTPIIHHLPIHHSSTTNLLPYQQPTQQSTITNTINLKTFRFNPPQQFHPFQWPSFHIIPMKQSIETDRIRLQPFLHSFVKQLHCFVGSPHFAEPVHHHSVSINIRDNSWISRLLNIRQQLKRLFNSPDVTQSFDQAIVRLNRGV
ncbi:hypothetical protein LINGRAHAP2_LOCUS13121 [Linum grandiflorum]